MRLPEDNLQGRDQAFLSEADLSGAMARQRRDPGLLQRMAVTTYEQRPDYPNYDWHASELQGQGVPIMNNFDISNSASANRLSGLAPNANLHFQMPRVPRVEGYSTQRLINDTLELPGHMGRSDISVSITTPDPSMYNNSSSHNRIYGLESGNAYAGTSMRLDRTGSDSDGSLENYGYTHKQSTKNQSAEVSAKRKKYKFSGAEHEDFKASRRTYRDDDDWGQGGGDFIPT